MFDKIRAYFARKAAEATARNDATYASLPGFTSDMVADHATLGARIADATLRNERARAKLPPL